MARSATMGGERLSDHNFISTFADLADDGLPLGGGTATEQQDTLTNEELKRIRSEAIAEERIGLEFQYGDVLGAMRGLELKDREGNDIPLEAALKLLTYARDPVSFNDAFVNPERYHVPTEPKPENQTAPDFWARKRTVVGSAAAWFASQRYGAGLVPGTLKHRVVRSLEHTAGRLAQQGYREAPTQVAHTTSEAIAYRAEQAALNEQYRDRIRTRIGERATKLADIANAPARRAAELAARRERREESKRKTRAITHAVERAQGAAAYYPRNLM